MPEIERPYNIARESGENDIIEASGVESLAVSHDEENLWFLQHMFDDADWKLFLAHTFREAMLELARQWVPIIICECELGDGNWKDVLSHTAPIAERPRVIVISSQADEQLWAEVLAMGGFDLLATPLKETEVAYVVGSAWLDWQDERERTNKHAVSNP